MSSVATNPPAHPSCPSVHGAPSVLPSLADLERMTSVAEERHVFKDVDWTFYEQLVDSIPEGVRIRVNYDGKDLEIMSLSPFHDAVKKRLGRLVELTSEELEVPCTALGQTTWKRPEVARGLEADECYYFEADKLAVVAAAIKRGSTRVEDYPNPDLGIEVDLSPSRIDRPGIYAALHVAELWRFDGEQVIIERLGPDGAYHIVEASVFLLVSAREIRRWVIDEDSLDGSRWARRLRAWERAELAPRLAR